MTQTGSSADVQGSDQLLRTRLLIRAPWRSIDHRYLLVEDVEKIAGNQRRAESEENEAGRSRVRRALY